MRLVVATRSKHKMKEIREILEDIPELELLDLDDARVGYSPEEEALEPFDTFEENASSKARYFRGKTGLPTVADDSGLEVSALGGAPGVRTKRFAPGDDLEGEARDQANNAHLLALLSGKPHEDRGARYVCVAALAWNGGEVEVFRGEAPGFVLEEPRGGGGFGYDPIILDESSGKSFAELTADEKNSRSHRGRAFRAMGAALRGMG
jgi:XTP/dITP diphosphohydrolase